ncbi:hypothetical protein QFZ33_000034 [Arthrobacter globiformis]|nr:hypothetical protein [Arthrobacter globiformis]
MTAAADGPALRIIVGADEAGVDYKNPVLEDLRSDPRVADVIDIGVNRSDEPDEFGKPYPHVGITAGEMIRDGQADRAILFCGTGIGVAIAANKVAGVVPPPPTTRSRWNGPCFPTTARSSPWASGWKGAERPQLPGSFTLVHSAVTAIRR